MQVLSLYNYDMNSIDIVTMLGNLSQSLLSVQTMVSGAAYLIGLTFFMAGLQKLKKIGDHRAGSSSQEKMFVPIAFFLGGAAFVFLPSALSTYSNTLFGSDSLLSYADYDKRSIYDIMAVIIRTAGLIWFVRGVILLVQASHPGVQHGPKGMAFLIAGIFAINFEYTVSIINHGLELFINVTLGSRTG